MGSPLGESGWAGAETYYAGAGGVELPWLLISGALCILAIVLGIAHERKAFKRHR